MGATPTPSRRHVCGAAVALCCLPAWRAQAEALTQGALAVTETATGVYVSRGVHTEATPENLGAIANVAFVVGRESVAVIDTGGCRRWGQSLRDAIRGVTPLPIRHVINSHVHPDHIFGNAAFADGAPAIVGHAKLPAALQQRGAFYLKIVEEALGALAEGTQILPPTVTVADRMEIDLGGRVLLLRAHPTAHTDNDLSVLDDATGTLFASDLLFMERTPALDGSLLGWLQVLDELRQLPAARVVPGHGPASAPWPAALDAQTRYLQILRDEIRQILKQGGTMEQAVETAGQGERGNWQLFDDYHPRNVVTAFAELEWE